MRRMLGAFILFSATSLALSQRAGAQGTMHHSEPAEAAMMTMLDEINAAPTVSVTQAENILKIRLKVDALQTNEFLKIYKGQSPPWKNVELRLPSEGIGARFVLVLEPAATIPMGSIMNHFGDVLAMEPPNPAAGANGLIGYTYKVKFGTIRFAFRDMQTDYAARVVLIDRM